MKQNNVRRIKSFVMLVVFTLNIAAFCTCGFAQKISSQKNETEDCCCCGHHKTCEHNSCKSSHTVVYSLSDKMMVQNILLHPLQQIAAPLVACVYEIELSHQHKFLLCQFFIDTGPPNFQTFYQTFRI